MQSHQHSDFSDNYCRLVNTLNFWQLNQNTTLMTQLSYYEPRCSASLNCWYPSNLTDLRTLENYLADVGEHLKKSRTEKKEKNSWIAVST